MSGDLPGRTFASSVAFGGVCGSVGRIDANEFIAVSTEPGPNRG
jgi:hypothetical protein